MIKVNQVFFSYKKQPVFQGINLSVERGEIYGIIGPDGSGKSTLMKLLATREKAASGSIQIYGMRSGRENQRIRGILGYVPERSYLPSELSVSELLKAMASLRNISWERALANMGSIYREIEYASDRKAAQLSGGMHQKLCICAAILHRPQVLLLDEPTIGIDLPSKIGLWTMINELRKKGMTIVMTTADMAEAERCGRVTILERGAILLSGSTQEITRSYQQKLYELEFGAYENPYHLMAWLSGMSEIENCYLKSGKVCFSIGLNLNARAVIALVQGRSPIKALQIRESQVTLEDCYIKMLKNGRI